MDQFLFKQQLKECKAIKESTTCFEVFLHKDSDDISVTKETPIDDNEVEDFLQKCGRFERKGPEYNGGIRLILQGNACHRDTFEPKFLSLPPNTYEKLVCGFQLPFAWLETASVVGPFFWSGLEPKGENPCLQMVYRKSDVKDRPDPRNWELALSHNINTGVTSGMFKGTTRSDVNKCVSFLTGCVGEIDHPMFLPMLVFSYDVDSNEDKRHRDNRERVDKLENTVTNASEIFANPDITKRDRVDLAQINNDLVDCHKKVLWKRPEGYLTILNSMENTLATFKAAWPPHRAARLEEIHYVMERRVKLLRAKLQGISTHRKVTISRLKVIESVLQNLVSLSIFRQEQEMRINKLARQQTNQLAEAQEEEHRNTQKAQRDLETMLETRKQTTISLLGIIFLPGAFFAAIFSTTFFDFQKGEAASTGVISKKFWVYWAFTIPITAVLFGLWYWWEQHIKYLLEKRDSKIRDIEAFNQQRRRRILAQPLDGF